MTITQPTWVFGYGSLIWKQDFPYLESRPGRITGWARRFWQGSHDHRGLEHDPGRVVTLVAAPGEHCDGKAFLVEPEVFEHLDHREKNGYRRFPVKISLKPRNENVNGVLYVADRDNPAFLGPAPMQQLANHIAASHGPSGSNRDYVLQLAEALRELGDDDPHVRELESLLSPCPPL